MARKRKVYNVISEKVQTHKVVSRMAVLENEDTKSCHIIKEQQIFSQDGTEPIDLQEAELEPCYLYVDEKKIDEPKMPNTYFKIALAPQKAQLEDNAACSSGTAVAPQSSSISDIQIMGETSSLLFANPFKDSTEECRFIESCPEFQLTKPKPFKERLSQVQSDSEQQNVLEINPREGKPKVLLNEIEQKKENSVMVYSTMLEPAGQPNIFQFTETNLKPETKLDCSAELSDKEVSAEADKLVRGIQINPKPIQKPEATDSEMDLTPLRNPSLHSHSPPDSLYFQRPNDGESGEEDSRLFPNEQEYRAAEDVFKTKQAKENISPGSNNHESTNAKRSTGKTANFDEKKSLTAGMSITEDEPESSLGTAFQTAQSHVLDASASEDYLYDEEDSDKEESDQESKKIIKSVKVCPLAPEKISLDADSATETAFKNVVVKVKQTKVNSCSKENNETTKVPGNPPKESKLDSTDSSDADDTFLPHLPTLKHLSKKSLVDQMKWNPGVEEKLLYKIDRPILFKDVDLKENGDKFSKFNERMSVRTNMTARSKSPQMDDEPPAQSILKKSSSIKSLKLYNEDIEKSLVSKKFAKTIIKLPPKVSKELSEKNTNISKALSQDEKVQIIKKIQDNSSLKEAQKSQHLKICKNFPKMESIPESGEHTDEGEYSGSFPTDEIDSSQWNASDSASDSFRLSSDFTMNDSGMSDFTNSPCELQSESFSGNLSVESDSSSPTKSRTKECDLAKRIPELPQDFLTEYRNALLKSIKNKQPFSYDSYKSLTKLPSSAEKGNKMNLYDDSKSDKASFKTMLTLNSNEEKCLNFGKNEALPKTIEHKKFVQQLSSVTETSNENDSSISGNPSESDLNAKKLNSKKNGKNRAKSSPKLFGSNSSIGSVVSLEIEDPKKSNPDLNKRKNVLQMWKESDSFTQIASLKSRFKEDSIEKLSKKELNSEKKTAQESEKKTAVADKIWKPLPNSGASIDPSMRTPERQVGKKNPHKDTPYPYQELGQQKFQARTFFTSPQTATGARPILARGVDTAKQTPLIMKEFLNTQENILELMQQCIRDDNISQLTERSIQEFIEKPSTNTDLTMSQRISKLKDQEIQFLMNLVKKMKNDKRR